MALKNGLGIGLSNFHFKNWTLEQYQASLNKDIAEREKLLEARK